MKPFSLKEYLKNPSKKVVTRDGVAVRIICTDFDNDEYPIVGAIKGYKCPTLFTKEGTTSNGINSSCDLYFAPEKKVGWVNIYRGKSGPITGGFTVFGSEEEAEEASRHCNGFTKDFFLATAKLEWEEEL